MKILKILGSLWLAITLIVALACLLAFSTIMESVHGTPFAQRHFYTTRWFDFFLSLLWVNIFCSTWTRWPFQKKHVGFIITHVGILTLLVGALLSRTLGVEGQMALFEGQAKDRLEHEKAAQQNAGDGVTEGAASDPPNRGVRATLSGEMMGVHESFVLLEHHPENPHAFFTDIGPAHFELKTENAEAPQGPFLKITVKSTQETWRLSLKEATSEIPLGQSGLVVSDVKYLPHAKVADNKIVETPDEVRFNPAVQFEVHDAKGQTERHTRFYLFPNFDSLRGGHGADKFGLDIHITDPPLPEEEDSSPSFNFIAKPGAQWAIRITSSKKAPVESPLELGKKIPTGWMDMTVEVHKTFERAVIARPAAPKKIELPFKLLLTDFRKVDYPGTLSPASFESDVVLHDPEDKVTIEKTVSMNKPLDYKGWRIFQSSYMQDQRFGEGSVFTIAKNPGIQLIYGSAPIILIGVILLFYFHPFFNDKVK